MLAMLREHWRGFTHLLQHRMCVYNTSTNVHDQNHAATHKASMPDANSHATCTPEKLLPARAEWSKTYARHKRACVCVFTSFLIFWYIRPSKPSNQQQSPDIEQSERTIRSLTRNSLPEHLHRVIFSERRNEKIKIIFKMKFIVLVRSRFLFNFFVLVLLIS